MASLLAIGLSAGISALAFSGTNYLFSSFSDHGKVERKRHNLYIEELEKDRNEYDKEEKERLDFINMRLREKKEARDYIQNLDSAMLEYYRVFGEKLKPLRRKPELSDYYLPSDQQKNGELLFVAAGTALSTFLVLKYIK